MTSSADNHGVKHGQRGQKGAQKKKGRVRRILLLLIFLLLIAIPSSVYFSYKSADDSIFLTFKEDNLRLDVGSPVSAMDCISDSEGDISISSDMLDTETAGVKELVYTVSKSLYGGLLTPTKEYTLHYSVSDLTPPIMLWSGDGTVLKKGTTFDIKEIIAYGDNSDPVPDVKVEGNIDMQTEGTYPLHVTVSDASGNSIDWDLNIIVSDIIPSYNDTSTSVSFKSFKSSYAAEGRSFGIDVSTWQGDIDFDAVKNAGCEFVMIRIGYSHEGEVTIDDKFRQNFERAREAGLKVGVYLYSYDNTEENVRSSAHWITEHLAGAKLELPVVFDWEDFGRFHTYEMSFMKLNELYDTFADEIAKSGYSAMLYGSKTYLEKIWTDTDVRPIWLAHYTDQTDYKGPYRIWQASSSGRIDGIAGAVDMNIMYE